MRPAFLLFPCFCLAASAMAQQQESRMNQILNQEPSGIIVEKDRTFYGGKSFGGVSNARTKEFYYNARYTPGAFQTKEFANARPWWKGGTLFQTKSANTSTRYLANDKNKKAEVKTARTSTARESGENFDTAAYDTDPFRAKGKRQSQLDEERKAMTPMTIDEVREMLNKNK